VSIALTRSSPRLGIAAEPCERTVNSLSSTCCTQDVAQDVTGAVLDATTTAQDVAAASQDAPAAAKPAAIAACV
jgi:hypothetical protein